MEDLGRVEEVVHDLRLILIDARHGFQTAEALEVLKDLAADVNRPAVRCVVHGAGVGMGLVHHVDRGLGVEILTDEILADNGDDHAGGADVLLHACVDHAVIADVAGLGEEHGRLVGDQRLALGVREGLPRRAVDGLVFADIDIVRVLVNGKVGAVGNVGIVSVLGGRGDVDLAVLLGLGNGLLGPCTGLDVDGLAVFQ